MRLNKTDGLTIGLITIAGIAILANGLLREPPVELTDSYQLPNEIESVSEVSPEVMAFTEENPLPIETVEIKESPPTALSFSEAFSEARRMRGPGAIFVWNGKSYTTSFAEELVTPGEVLDSTQINFVLNESPKK